VRHPLEIEVIPDGAAVICHLTGELDMATVDTLKACVDSVDNGFGTIVLELSALKFLDSTGIGYFVRVHKDLAPQFRRLELRGASSHVRHVLELSGVTQFIPTSSAAGGMVGPDAATQPTSYST
jgi:anti-anti-sigma factor